MPISAIIVDDEQLVARELLVIHDDGRDGHPHNDARSTP